MLLQLFADEIFALQELLSKARIVLLLDVGDVDVDELGERDRERSLLAGEVHLEKLEKGLKVHRQVSRQILDDLVHVAHVDQIESLRKGHRFRIRLIAGFDFSLLFHVDKGLLKDVSFVL